MARRTSKQDRYDALSKINASICDFLSMINEVENDTPGFRAPEDCEPLGHEINRLLVEAMDKL